MKRTFNKPYHYYNYPQMQFKQLSDDEIINEVVCMFQYGCSYIEPAMTYFVSIIYSFLMEKYFNINWKLALNDKNLLFGNAFFKTYNESSYIYDNILKQINSIFWFESINDIIKLFENEYINNAVPSGAWIFPDESINYVSNNFVHYHYLCFLYNDEEFKQDIQQFDENLYQYKNKFLQKYLNKGFIRILCNPNVMAITIGNNYKYSDNIIKAMNFLLKYNTFDFQNTNLIKYIVENINTHNFNEFNSKNDFINYLKNIGKE